MDKHDLTLCSSVQPNAKSLYHFFSLYQLLSVRSFPKKNPSKLQIILAASLKKPEHINN